MKSIKHCFNQAAAYYDNYCQLQMAVGGQLIQLIKQYSLHYAAILDLGCGTGLVTQQLARQITFTDFYALDNANLLLAKAKTHLAGLNICIKEADFDQPLNLTRPFDLIFSNLALHWSMHLPDLFKSIQPLMAKNGLFAFSIPLTDTFHELSHHFSHNSFYSLTKLRTLLTEQGYKVFNICDEKREISFSNTKTALQSIKQVGASYVSQRKHKGLRGKNFFTNFNVNQLTYHVGYFLLFKNN